MRFIAVASLTLALAELSGCAKPNAARDTQRDSATIAQSVTPRVDRARSDSSNGRVAPPLEPRKDSITERADRGRIMGDSSASVWLVMASDFQCPWCKRWHDSTFAQVVQNYVRPGKIRLAYLNFPLQMHRNAGPAAEAAMCASVQGRFWELHDALFIQQDRWDELPNAMPVLDSIAARTGVSMPAWRSCMSTHSTRALIQADRDRAAAAGVQSTPTFFVGDQKVDGYEPYAQFRTVIDAALAKQGGRAKPSRP